MKSKFTTFVMAVLVAVGLVTLPGTPALATTCEPSCYYYAGGYDAAPPTGTTGALILMDIAKPTLGSDGKHSLAELAVQSADLHQAVEAGWTVDPGLNGGSSDPFLFVFRWINNVPQGYNTAGGFVPCGPSNSLCTTAPTKGVGQSVLSDLGTLKQFDVEFFNGNWWVSYNNQHLGYYRGTDWSSPAFTGAGYVQAFGEVNSTHDSTLGAGHEVCTGMGNNNYGGGTNTTGARMGSLTYVGSTTLGLTMYSQSVGSVYGNHFITTTTTRSFYYGGKRTTAPC